MTIWVPKREEAPPEDPVLPTLIALAWQADIHALHALEARLTTPELQERYVMHLFHEVFPDMDFEITSAHAPNTIRLHLKTDQFFSLMQAAIFPRLRATLKALNIE